jgi:DNA replication initiation complex subunit (GINS family)
MYNELFTAWRREIEEVTLGTLSPDFYVRIADYLRHIQEENKIIDKKSLKVILLEHEAQNAKWMLDQLLRARYKKLVKTITQNEKLPSDSLTSEEVKICESFVVFANDYKKFANDLIKGQTAKLDEVKVSSKVEPEANHKRMALRFTKSIPAIIGADMKLYGPFIAEDVASLPVENAKILVKQGLAALIEVS